MPDHEKGAENANTVLILYPWGIDSVINKSMGAGLRIGLLSEFLRDQGYTVTVASIGLRSRELSSGGVRFVQLRYPSNIALLLAYGSALTLAKVAQSHAFRAFLYFRFPRFDSTFAHTIRERAAANAHVLLEYPFWQAILDGPDAILTDHDIISESWAGRTDGPLGRMLHDAVLRHEISAMQGCGRTVVVSENDRQFFLSRAAGDPLVIENPIRLPVLWPDEDGPDGDRSTTRRSRALFIGGGWYPNVQAARSIAYGIAPNCPEIEFILAGECSRNLRRVPRNVICLGQIPSSTLDRQYRDATYAVIPLQEGTGSSLKTIEALAYGKVVIATSIGVRGLPFENGVHGIICDDLQRLPEVLRSLEDDPDRRARLSRSALALSKSYDYRVIFKKYLEIMHRSAEYRERGTARRGDGS
jgi:glycosyltransferase involved in cell wall biosynthesis